MLPVVFDFKHYLDSSIIYHAEFQPPNKYLLTWYSPARQCHKNMTYDLRVMEQFVCDGTWVITAQEDASYQEDDIEFDVNSIL